MPRKAPLTRLSADTARSETVLELLEATVLSTPAAGEMLRVEIDSQPGHVRDCPWAPRFQTVVTVDGPVVVEQLPEPDDAALVAESDEGNAWVVMWWPQ
jgi:hypothetical protein